MPRKQKPVGYENWTWDEINLGRKLSKAEKRNRRMLKNLGGVEDEDGEIEPPETDAGNYYLGIVALIVVVVIGVIVEINR